MEALGEYDKRRENRLDKFLDHINPDVNRPLKPKDTQYLELMRKAKHWRDNFFSPDQVRKMIMQEEKYSYSMACQVYSCLLYTSMPVKMLAFILLSPIVTGIF